jgi:hypothetical protein
MFKLKNTYANPAAPANAQRGSPAPGTNGQQTGPARRPPGEPAWVDRAPGKPRDTWFAAQDIVDAQRGSPAPEGTSQAYQPGQVTQPVPDGKQYYRETRQFSRGAQRNAPITGIVLSTPNPGAYVPFKPSVVPRYPLGQYINNTIFWTNQIIPTTVKLSGLQTEDAIDELLSTFKVYGKSQAV